MKIQFRAYNKNTKELCDVSLVCFINRYVHVLPESPIDRSCQQEWKFEDIVLMQYIGTTRKGVDVYQDVNTLTTPKDYRRGISKLEKKLNNTRKICTEQTTANTNRKKQTVMWNQFFKKLLSEGRITVDELRQYSKRKPK